MKCQTLVRSKWIPETKTPKGDIIRAHSIRVSAEPCGEECELHEVRMADGQHAASQIWIRQPMCSKHKSKAEREGMEVRRVEITVESVQN